MLLALIALQQSCGTNTVPPPAPSPVYETEKAESAGGALAEVAPELLEGDADAGKRPKLSLGPAPREIAPESLLAAPERELASLGTKYDTVLMARTFGAPPEGGWEYRQNQQGKIVGFEFSNRGGNRILPHRHDIDKNLFFTRDFKFRFDDRARQDIHLFVTDWAPSRDKQFRLSELMNSVMHFFPRSYVPAIVQTGDRSIVTLPTGEEVEFDAGTREILSGAFSEAPVDLNPDKAARKFAAIHYMGKGVVVRANARGTDPRLGTTATITAGSVACEGAGCKNPCVVPAKELWEQKGATRFIFATDREFDRYLISRCGFGLPKAAPDSMVASAVN